VGIYEQTILRIGSEAAAFARRHLGVSATERVIRRHGSASGHAPARQAVVARSGRAGAADPRAVAVAPGRGLAASGLDMSSPALEWPASGSQSPSSRQASGAMSTAGDFPSYCHCEFNYECAGIGSGGMVIDSDITRSVSGQLIDHSNKSAT